MDEIKAAQVEDSSVGPVYKFVEGSEHRPLWQQLSHLSRESKTLQIGWDRLRIEDGLLYYHWKGQSPSDENTLKLVLHEWHRSVVLK